MLYIYVGVVCCVGGSGGGLGRDRFVMMVFEVLLVLLVVIVL